MSIIVKEDCKYPATVPRAPVELITSCTLMHTIYFYWIIYLGETIP